MRTINNSFTNLLLISFVFAFLLMSSCSFKVQSHTFKDSSVAEGITDVLQGKREIASLEEFEAITDFLVDTGKHRYKDAHKLIRQQSIALKQDIVYQTDDPSGNSNTLDVYFAPDQDDADVIIFFHGGAWVGGDKNEIAYLPLAFVSQGFVVISVNYPLRPEADFNKMMHSSANAVSWVKENIGQYGGSPQKISLMGHSAGAHIALSLVLNDHFLSEKNINVGELKTVTLLDLTVNNMLTYYQENKLIAYLFKGLEHQIEMVSPLHNIQKNKSLPKFLFAIAEQRDTNYQSALPIINSLKSEGHLVEHLVVPETDHGSIALNIGQPNYGFTKTLLDFIRE